MNVESLQKILTQLRRYPSIIVTGGQRSGTQIASKIIAHESGLRFIHESRFSVHDIDTALDLLDGSVIHAPALFHYWEQFPKDSLKLFIVRDISDIKQSINRIKWKHEQVELDKINIQYKEIVRKFPQYCSAELKYQIFLDKYIFTKNSGFITYNMFKNHPMFVDKEHRLNFTPWQTNI